MKTEITAATFAGPAAVIARLQSVEADLRSVGRIVGEITWETTTDPLQVSVELAA